MTAKELHDHVIQWPEGARPKGLRLHTAGWFVEDRKTGRRAEGETLRVDFQFCNPTTSIALHVASGLEWLRRQQTPGHYVCLQRMRDDGSACRINRFKPMSETWEELGRGDNVFHAIHAAILATKENA